MTEAQGIVLQVEDERIRQRAAQHHLPVRVQAGYDLPWERTLFLDPAIGRVPWGQIPRGFDFLARWEAAAPVWSYETLAADVAAGAERERTEALIGDLRVPLYEVGLLFVRRCEAGEQLLEAWERERAGGHGQLAFLRALYIVKPRFCALPRSWLRDVAVGVLQAAPVKVRKHTSTLVRVEVAPGRFVRCKPGEEEKTKAIWEQRALSRKARRQRGTGNQSG